MSLSIYNSGGYRKYLTGFEVEKFVIVASYRQDDIKTFCYMIAFTGCRISEALSLTANSIDFEAKSVIIRSLKKRGKCVYRAIPVPPSLLALLSKMKRKLSSPDDLLWPWCRMTGYRRICETMQAAGISGDYATPRGLRHGFGVHAIQSGVPLNLVQRWLGHADIKTTAIYTDAIGAEERSIAARMWNRRKNRGLPEEESSRDEKPAGDAGAAERKSASPALPHHDDALEKQLFTNNRRRNVRP